MASDNHIQTPRLPVLAQPQQHAGGQSLSPQGEALVSRSASEVQAAMMVAKRFPRNEVDAFNRIMKACERPGLAGQAIYAYPKGGQKVDGPSIRLAEALAQHWGNIDYGISELENTGDESTVMAHAWDLETNTRRTMIFSVRHVRHTRGGDYALTDPREVYENMANMAARRLRACILGIIPGDIIDAALEKCEETLKKGNSKPLSDRIREMVSRFHELGVSREQIEKRLGHKVEATGEGEILQLVKVFKSIKDGFSKAADFFPPDAPTAPTQSPPKPETQPPGDEKAPPPAGELFSTPPGERIKEIMDGYRSKFAAALTREALQPVKEEIVNDSRLAEEDRMFLYDLIDERARVIDALPKPGKGKK